ncbi:MAG TPA: hypothetical protein VI037_05670 [Nitrososphaera sp.]
MSNIIVGNGGGRGGAAVTAITVMLILMASPVILTTTTTKAFAAPISNKDCNDIQFRPYESSSFYSKQADHTLTIETSQHEYSVDIDNVIVSNTDDSSYYKNVDAKDPKGLVLLPAGGTINITLVTQEGGGNVFLYNDKVSDCQILLGQVQDKDKIGLKTVSIEVSDDFPSIAKQTVQVPDASDVVGKHFTKLGIQLKYNPEVHEYWLISHRVQVR